MTALGFTTIRAISVGLQIQLVLRSERRFSQQFLALCSIECFSFIVFFIFIFFGWGGGFSFMFSRSLALFVSLFHLCPAVCVTLFLILFFSFFFTEICSDDVSHGSNTYPEYFVPSRFYGLQTCSRLAQYLHTPARFISHPRLKSQSTPTHPCRMSFKYTQPILILLIGTVILAKIIHLPVLHAWGNAPTQLDPTAPAAHFLPFTAEFRGRIFHTY